MTRLRPRRPESLRFAPIELRPRTEDEERALLFAAGSDPLVDLDLRRAGFGALAILLAFVIAALLR